MQFSKTITSGASACGADGIRYPVMSRLWVDCFPGQHIIFKEVLTVNLTFCSAPLGVEERSHFPMDYGHLMIKLSAEGLVWKQPDLALCMDWNGYISLLCAVDSDQIWNRLTWILTMLWSPNALLDLHYYNRSARGFMDAYCTSFWIRPFL